MNALSDVSAFHRKFRITDPDEPELDALDLRVRLLREEAQEFYEATTEEGKLDAICDSFYVHAGAVLQLGLRRRYSALFTARYPMPFQFREGLLAHVERLDMVYGEEWAHEAIIALCDLEYELNASVKDCGFEPIIEEAFARVQKANMGKTWSDEEIRERFRVVSLHNNPFQWIEQGHILYRLGQDEWIVKDAGGKIKKQPSFQHPTFEDLLAQSATA